MRPSEGQKSIANFAAFFKKSVPAWMAVIKRTFHRLPKNVDAPDWKMVIQIGFAKSYLSNFNLIERLWWDNFVYFLACLSSALPPTSLFDRMDSRIEDEEKNCILENVLRAAA